MSQTPRPFNATQTATFHPFPRHRSRPDDFDDDCEQWLHDCAASSMDGTFSRTKERICTFASTERCSAYFEESHSSTTTLLGSYYHSRRRSPLSLGGHTSDGGFIPSSVSATSKLQPSSRLFLSPVWTLVGCNAVAWTSVYALCFAANKVRARRLSRARRASNDGNLVEVGEGDASADVAAAGGAVDAGVVRSSADNAPNVEQASQQAPMASGSLQLAGLSPGLVSPPNIRTAKREGSTAATQARSNLSCSSPLSSLSAGKDVVIPNSNMVQVEGNGEETRRCSATISSGGAKPTRRGKPSNNRGERGKRLASPPLASHILRSSSAPSVLTSLETKALKKGDKKEVGAFEAPASSNKASLCLGMHFSEPERELGKTIGAGQSKVFAPAIPSVGSSEAVSTHSSTTASDSPSAAASVSASPGLGVQAATHGSLLDTPSTPSTTYSACWDMLGEACTDSISLHDTPNRETDVALAGWTDAGTQDTDVLNAGTCDVTLSSNEGLESSTGDPAYVNSGQRTSWVEPPRGLPAGLTVKHPAVNDIQFPGLDATRSQLSGPIAGVEEAKGTFVYEISCSGVHREHETHACLDGVGEGIAEKKEAVIYEVSSAAVERELGAHTHPGVIGGEVKSSEKELECKYDSQPNSLAGVVVEAKEESVYQVLSTPQQLDLDDHARLEFIGGGATEGKKISPSQISSAENVGKLEAHARSDAIGGGTTAQSGPSARQMSSAQKELELKLVLGLVKDSPEAHSTAGSEAPRSPTSPISPRWGNTSTLVPLRERHRRSLELFEAVQQPRDIATEELQENEGDAQPAEFPDDSTWPSGDGYTEWDGPGDRLPPPSDYEVQEAAKMMDVYNQAMRELGLEP